MDVSRRKALGLFAGAAGGVGVAACGQTPGENGQGTPPEAFTAPTSPVVVTFEHGVASGDALQDRIILWTRVTPKEDTTEQVPVQLVISTSLELIKVLLDEDSELPSPPWNGRVIPVSTSASRDFTVKVDAVELEPNTPYFYTFAVKTSEGIVYSPIGKTRTLPETGGDQAKFAVVSCSNFPFGYFNVYKAISERDDIDAVIHLGDYFYEYGIDGYGGKTGVELGRNHLPATETVTLADYRARHAQYKTDADLQAAHAIAPWYCTWDDHESTNNSYRTGAQNHNPEDGEGDWTERKQIAVQAYLEWMPVRDPVPGRARESIYRSADWGDLASVFMLESRLTGRSDEISWSAELSDIPPEDIPMKAMTTLGRVADPNRTMLGKVQEDWLSEGLKSSVEGGKTWQLLANQVIMAAVVPPKFNEVLTPEQIEQVPQGFGQLLVQFSQLGLPWNLDAWDGFPAARERLFDAAKEAGARLVTITGDTHTAWANMPMAMDGTQMGVEFGCTSVTSPGLGTYLPLPNLGELFSDANASVEWFDPFGSGYTLLTLTSQTARADYFKVSTISEPSFETELVATFEATAETDGVSALKRV